MLINSLSRVKFADTLGRFITLLAVCSALCVASPIVSAQTKKVRTPARGTKPGRDPLSQMYQGFRLTVNSAERADSISGLLRTIEPPDKSLEIVRINMTVKYLGKGDSIQFKGYKLTGSAGSQGVGMNDSGMKLGSDILYLSKDNPVLSSDIYFVMPRDVELTTFESGDLVFDISGLKVTKQATFKRRGH